MVRGLSQHQRASHCLERWPEIYHCPAGTPTLNPLSSPQTSTTVTFTWHTVTDAGSYELWVSDNSRTSGKVTTVSKIAGSFTTLTLTSGHSYTWYVAAVSTNTVVTVWSTGSTFSVQ